MGIVGDVGRYTQYAAAESLDLAAANTGGGAGVGMGLGAGAAVAQVLATSLKSSARRARRASCPGCRRDRYQVLHRLRPAHSCARKILRGVREGPVNCPSCGAPITLRPDTEGYKCDYCHTVFYPGEQDTGVEITGAATRR